MLKLLLIIFLLVNLIWIGSQNNFIKNLFGLYQNQAQTNPSSTPFPSSEIPIFLPTQSFKSSPLPTPEVTLNTPGDYKLLPEQKYVYQTYNNCGPATLSMLLDFYDTNLSQQEIASELRPYNNPQGFNDDKSVTLDELASFAVSQGFTTFKRPNGDIEKLKLFLANDIPVITITWIDQKGGFGHYRIVKGYNQKTNQIIQDDTIFGQQQSVGYSEFTKLWQVFNYDYLVVVPSSKTEIVKAILKSELSEKVAYTNALNKAKEESGDFATFNQSINQYYLGNYPESLILYERVAQRLPYRLLWYQIEPISAYFKQKDYDKVFASTEQIFKSGNPSASELYQLRGESYLELGNKSAAKAEFEKALIYNNKYQPARESLNKI